MTFVLRIARQKFTDSYTLKSKVFRIYTYIHSDDNIQHKLNRNAYKDVMCGTCTRYKCNLIIIRRPVTKI